MKFTNLKIYYFLIFSNNLWFITSNWLNFWLKYMSLKEVGIIDALAFLFGILLEFPSGLLSDKLGRKQALLLSQSVQFLGSFLILFATNLFEIGLGFVIFQIGVAFFSGTIESFGYESSIKERKDYDEVLVKSGYFTNFAYLIALILGGYLYTFNNNYPNLLFAFNFLLGIIPVLLIYELKSEIVPEDIDNLYLKKFNLYIVGLFVLLMTVSFTFDYGFLKLFILEKFSSLENNYWFIFGSTLVSLIISSWFLKKIKSFFIPLFTSFVLVIVGFLLTFLSFLPLFFILSFLAVFIYQLSLKYINDKVPDSSRASIISLFNLLYKLPYVLIALILGYNLG